MFLDVAYENEPIEAMVTSECLRLVSRSRHPAVHILQPPEPLPESQTGRQRLFQMQALGSYRGSLL